MLLYLLAFAIPLPYIYINILLFAFLLTWLLQVNFKNLIVNLAGRKILWAYILYFCLFALSYFYSENKAQSLFDTGSKTFLLIMPVVIGAGLSISRKQLEHIFFAFICGVTLVAIISYSVAYREWQATGEFKNLFYHNLVDDFDANAVYQALYTFFSISLLLIFKWTGYFNDKTRYLKYLVLIIQIVFFVFLSARMLTLLFVFFLLPFYITYTLKSEINFRKTIITLVSFSILLTLVVVTENPIKDRFKDFFLKSSELAFMNDYSNVKEEDFNNLTLRLFLWRLGIENVHEKKLWLTGSGNGDAQAMQNSKMKEYGIQNIHEDIILRSPLYNANLHNMYLQSLIMVGILGLVLLVIITAYPFFIYQNAMFFKWFLPFHVSTTFFMIQESMFQTQAGLAYYSFFSAIYISMYFNEKQVSKKLM